MGKINKICFLISDISKIGGTERVCCEIANMLFIGGFQIHVLSMYDSKPFFKLAAGIKSSSVLAKKVNKLLIPHTIWKLRRKLQMINPDVIIDVDSALFIYTRLASLKMPLKIIIWEHFNFQFARQALARRWSRKFALKFADAIITLTAKDRAVWQKFTSTVPIFHIPNPAPTVPVQLKRVEKRKIVLSVGRLTSQKGFDLLLEVWENVRQNDISNWTLYIVGSGELENVLKKKIAQLNFETSVQLIPSTREIEKYYQQAAIFCMTSRFEGFPMVLLEAQAFGLPLVSFNCETGPSEIITSGYNGILVENGNINAMAKELSTLMDSEETRRKYGNNSLKNAQKYQGDEIIKLWFKVFSELSEPLK